MRTVISLVFLLTAVICLGQQDEVNDAFAKANQAYTAENYEIAIDNYNQILKSGLHSVETYFNLANAHYKLNQVGPAIYNYEKALQLDPDNSDVLTNLSYAQQMRIDAIEALPENELGSAFDTTVASLDVDEWAWLSIMLIIITILLYIFYNYSNTTGKKRLFFILMIIGILLSTLSIAAGFYAQNNLNSKQYAIFYEAEYTTREEPKNNATPSFVIHEGTKVEILEEFNDWVRIALANGTKAWVPNSTVKWL